MPRVRPPGGGVARVSAGMRGAAACLAIAATCAAIGGAAAADAAPAAGTAAGTASTLSAVARRAVTSPAQNLLADVAAGQGFDVPLASLTDRTRAAATVTSVRGPNVPVAVPLHPQPSPQQPPLPPPQQQQQQQQRAAHAEDETTKMDREFQRFLASKSSKLLPPLEQASTTTRPGAADAPPAARPPTSKLLETAMAKLAVDEYDQSRRARRDANPKLRYIRSVNKLRSNALAANKRLAPPVPAQPPALQPRQQQPRTSQRAPGIPGMDTSQRQHQQQHPQQHLQQPQIPPQIPQQIQPQQAPGDPYHPDKKHFGFASPMEFVDSFDPFATHAVGNGNDPPKAPPMAGMPGAASTAGGGGLAPPPTPVHGASASGLASQILQSTPTYQYTKIDPRAAASMGNVLGSRGTQAMAARNNNKGPSLADAGPFSQSGPGAQAQLTDAGGLPIAIPGGGGGGGGAMGGMGSVGGMGGGGGGGGVGAFGGGVASMGAGVAQRMNNLAAARGVQQAPPLPSLPGHAGFQEAESNMAVQAFQNQQAARAAQQPSIPQYGAGPMRRRR